MAFIKEFVSFLSETGMNLFLKVGLLWTESLGFQIAPKESDDWKRESSAGLYQIGTKRIGIKKGATPCSNLC